MPYKDPEKQAEYQRRWVSNRRQEYFSGKRCEKCGSQDRLQLDHRNPGKKVTHRIWSWSKKRREEEIRKCQVLCHFCHVKKTNSDMNYGLKHGTRNGYDYHGCRCDACSRAKFDAVNESRKKLRAHRKENRVAA